MTFYRPISKDYEAFGARLKNPMNSWGAENDTHVVMTSWADMFDEAKRRVVILGPDWKRNHEGKVRPGYRDHVGRLEAIRSGTPFFILLATDKGRGFKKRKIDPRVPRRCLRGVGLVEEEGITYAVLGEEIDHMSAENEMLQERREAVINYNKSKQPLEEPEITEDLIEDFEVRYPKLDPNRICQVYVVSMAGGGNHFKVGFAKEVERRLKSLQTGNPYPLDIEYVSSEMTAIEARAWERSIHERLPGRLQGEWFEAVAMKQAGEMVRYAHPLEAMYAPVASGVANLDVQ